ncbi:DsbA family protein [Actinacidiphila rubida]|uniref:Protein-disulfide isomerase n=1 Tax=Actinacidiphila rubida TaxID=310780 RepID=A0A1H8FT10_9ACTN|nr:thioredoxin domain-containing protein [Actinacidiphila rubida]SEN34700.1 Protein-disulfide isomerase [Actinacidiphila rubida]
MTESKGPQAGDAAVPGKKKRKTPLDRVRPYAMTLVVMAVVFGGSAVIGAHVRGNKDTKVKEPTGAAAPVVVPTGPQVSPSPTDTPKGPKLDVPVHPTVPVTVTVYEDLRSPVSKAFYDEYSPMLTQLLTTGQVQIHYRLVTASDKKYGGDGSLKAAAAAACAQDQTRFTQFVDQVFRHQPDPQTDSLAHEAFLKNLALKAHKIKMQTFEPCIEQGDHIGWVSTSQTDFAASGLGDVPAVEIDNKPVKDVSGVSPQKLRSMILAEAKHVIAVQATPSPTSTMVG